MVEFEISLDEARGEDGVGEDEVGD